VRGLGITENVLPSDMECELLSGRPRSTAILASHLIEDSTVSTAFVKCQEFFEHLVEKVRLKTSSPQRGKAEKGSERNDVYGGLASCAYVFILGKELVLTLERDLALTYGVCALNAVNDSEHGRKCGYVVAEPMLVSVLVDGAERKFEEEQLYGHSAIGFMFEEYLALNVDQHQCRQTDRRASFMPIGSSLCINYCERFDESTFSKYDEADALMKALSPFNLIFPGARIDFLINRRVLRWELT